MAQLQSTSVSGSVLISGSTSSTGLAQILGSGSTVLYVSGSTGGLLAVSDSTSGSLLAVYTGSTLIFNVDAGLNTTVSGSLQVSGAVVISGSTVTELTVVGNQVITGSLIVSGSNEQELVVMGETVLSGSTLITGSLIVTGSIRGNISASSTVFGVVIANPTGGTLANDLNNYAPAGWNDADPNKATTLAISASNSLKLTGLTGGSQGRVAILRNTSKDRLIILENNSLSSSAANTFAMRTPVFLIPSESFSFVYDASISRWIPWGQSLGYLGFFDQYEEFTGAPAATTAQQSSHWAPAFAGTGATVAISTYLQNATERNVGIVQVTTGTTAAGRSHFGFAQNNAMITGFGQGVCLSRVALQAIATAAQYFVAYSGWQNSVGLVSASNAVSWYYDISGSTTWRGIAVSGTISSSLGVGGPTADTNYVWLGIYVSPQWTRACYFYSIDSVNWVIAGEVSGSFPTASSGTAIGFGTGLTKFNGITGNLMSIDTLAHRYDIVRG